MNYSTYLFFYILAISFISTIPVYSQTSISGKILDTHNQPLAFANVLLLQAKDSTLIKGIVTKENGSYLFEKVSAGNYLLAASMMSYKQKYSLPLMVTPDKQMIEVQPLLLEEATKQLDAVTVEATRPLFEQQLDRLVVNVQSSITAAGSTALEVLERSPGITINRQNSSIAMSGKDGVVVMINGKQSRVPMATIVQMLSSMNAGNIEKIELITTPSANYDAEGNAGVINIVVKKNTDYGTNGTYTLTMGYGWYARPAASMNINHRTEKLNMYGDYSIARSYFWQNFENNRLVNHQEQVIQTISTSSRRPVSQNHNARFGFDYTLSPKTTISGLVAGFSNKFIIDESSSAKILHNQKLNNFIDVQHEEINHWQHLMGNLSVQHKISGTQQIQADADYLYYYDNNPHTYLNTHQSVTEQMYVQDQLRISKVTPIRLFVGKIDYTNKLTEQTKLEMGIKGTLSELDNNVALSSLEEEGWQRDNVFSVDMHMKENIGAAYLNLHHQINAKTKVQAGLRYEYTLTDLSTPDDPKLLQRRYGNLFPSVFISRDFTAKSSLQLSYGRRITRPTYNNLAPFVYFIDPSTFFSGNIKLRPAITDALQATYRFNAAYLLSLGYSYDKTPIIPWQVHVDPETNQQYARAENLSSSRTYSFTFTIPVKITSWWSMQNNLMGVLQDNRTQYKGQEVHIRAGYASINTTQSFSLPASFSAEISGFYQTRSPFGIAYRKAFGALNVGIQKKLKQDKGTLRLAVDDLFWTTAFVLVSKQPDLNLNSTFKGYFSEPRIVRLTYSRSFGNKNVKAVTNRSTGSEDERKRVGN